MTPQQQALIDKACSRKNLGREEQRRLALEYRDLIALNKYQANMIREMRDEIIRLKKKESKIPDLTTEIAQRVEANADALAAIGAKEWMKSRRKKANMTELEQKEAVRKLEEEKLNDKGT